METKNNNKWVVKTIAPEEVYTDREEFLEYFYSAARNAAGRRTMSTVLLGQRRMGKTEIFKRVVNRLFFEQDPNDPDAVAPVYYSFQDAFMDEGKFAKDYLENFIRYYVGFYTSRPEIVRDAPKEDELLSIIQGARASFPFPGALDRLLRWHDAIVKREVYLPQKDAVEIPRRVSDNDDSTIVMFLDEFQNTRLPQYKFEIVGFMQEAVESPTCPHFVTGSAMSILAGEIIGRGSLFGRFDSEEIEPLSGYHGARLAQKAAMHYGVELSDLMAPVLAKRCGGNPFYITAVVRQAAKLKKSVQYEEALNEILAVDISTGFIWDELYSQVTRWISRINEHGITKWILYLAALEEKKRIDLKRIQEELWRQEKKEVDLEMIRDVLVKLSRGDLLDYKEFGGWFGKLNDPILNEFLKVWGEIEAKGENRNAVRHTTVQKYKSSRKIIDEYKGYLAEVYMIQILWNSQRKMLPGAYFNSAEDIEMPDRFFYMVHRGKLGEGKDLEVDIYAAAGMDVWIAESKWWTKNKVGPDSVKRLLHQAEMVREREEGDPRMRVWLFAHNGATPTAEALMRKHGVLWSTRENLDSLLKLVNLRTLPEL